jgi:hypothetical protein
MMTVESYRAESANHQHLQSPGDTQNGTSN